MKVEGKNYCDVSKVYVAPIAKSIAKDITNFIDLSNYKGIKFPTKESMILEIAKMLKKPVSEIQKKKTLINAAYKQRFDL
mgnify:CR=1 FL=1